MILKRLFHYRWQRVAISLALLLMLIAINLSQARTAKSPDASTISHPRTGILIQPSPLEIRPYHPINHP
ncbi:MAG: hypothetical protein JSV36_18930 [Anaerolineae bacterium]|nr:MAG: hypothetical protein JSV36_18930 [Anaerolineae bacterium]